MTQKGLIISSVIFFIVVNTTYFWEGKLGIWSMPATILLALFFVVLAIAWIQQLFHAIKEKFKDKGRLLLVSILTTVLCLSSFFPSGLIDFEAFSGKDLLIAQREGAANCFTVLKLKDNHTFIEKITCFGVREIKRSYKIINDTIYFQNISSVRNADSFYKFAVIRLSKEGANNYFDLIRFSHFGDSTGHMLRIVKYNLGQALPSM